MLLDHKREFVYIAVPKTASLSVHFTLTTRRPEEPDLYHQGIHQVLARHPEAASYQKLSMVRNPWDRLLSLYLDFRFKRVHQYSHHVRVENPLFGEFVDFEDFCLRIGESPWMNNIFLRAQFDLLSINDELVMDYIGRFEHLEESFAEICCRIGIERTLERINTGIRKSTSYREYYSDAAREAVAKLYARDIEAFGYEF